MIMIMVRMSIDNRRSILAWLAIDHLLDKLAERILQVHIFFPTQLNLFLVLIENYLTNYNYLLLSVSISRTYSC